jgi:N-acetylglutamate synthase-like GNAT family acetyltransferase
MDSATATSSETSSQIVRVEPATLQDLPELTDLVMSLMEIEEDFEPDRVKQEHGLKLILEQPNRGRIFVVRSDHKLIGMVNLLFTISTAEGGFVILMEDVIIRPEHRGHGYGAKLLQYVIDFAKKKDFKRITLLTDRIDERSQHFFARHGFILSHMVPMRLILNPAD